MSKHPQKPKRDVYSLVVGLLLGVCLSFAVLGLRNRTAPAPIVIRPAPTPTLRPTPGPIHVFVNGSVVEEGIFRLAADARVEDAIAAAGGFAADASIDNVNLAATLSDGMQIYVGSTSEVAAAPVLAVAIETPSAELVDINSADVEQLQTLPGIGPSTARAIVLDREDNGPFLSAEDIMRVSGIGPGKFSKIADLIDAR